MMDSTPDIAAILIISALLLLFASIVAFILHVTSSDGRDMDYEHV